VERHSDVRQEYDALFRELRFTSQMIHRSCLGCVNMSTVLTSIASTLLLHNSSLMRDVRVFWIAIKGDDDPK
jgi:hypothetical protein